MLVLMSVETKVETKVGKTDAKLEHLWGFSKDAKLV